VHKHDLGTFSKFYGIFSIRLGIVSFLQLTFDHLEIISFSLDTLKRSLKIYVYG
jgi:hypothetical protein